MISQDQLANKSGLTLALDILEYINLRVETFYSFLVPTVFELAVFPPNAVFLDKATAERFKIPSESVFNVSIVEFTSLNDGALQRFIGLFPVSGGRLVWIRLGRGRIHATDERVIELELLVGSYHYGERSPDDSDKSAY